MTMCKPPLAGLAPTRLKTYYVLSHIEPACIADIAETANLHRDTVRDSLNDLEARGLVVEVETTDRRKTLYATGYDD